VGLLPPDIDTALRIDTKRPASCRPFFVRMPGAAAPRVPCCVRSECVKKISRRTQLFVMMRYYEYLLAGLDIKTCVLLR
jgi:hypothetical protein